MTDEASKRAEELHEALMLEKSIAHGRALTATGGHADRNGKRPLPALAS
jgi:hypothetical protein